MHQPQLAGQASAPLAEMPKPRLNLPGVLGFFMLAALCTTNINFITQALFGTGQVFSVAYFGALLVVLFSFGMKLSLPLGSHGKLWMFAIGLFLVVSTRLGMGIDRSYFTSPQSNLYRTIAAQLITIACALAVRHLYLVGKSQMALRILFFMMTAASLTIVLTHYYPGIYVHLNVGTQGRAGGFFLDPNRAGQACCMTAAFGFATLINETNKFKPFVYAGMVSLIPCVFFTYSRSALIFLSVLVMMQFIISPIMKQKGTLIAILILAVGVPIGIKTVLSQRGSNVNAMDKADLEARQNRMQSLFNILSGNFDDNDTGHRWRVASVGIRYFVRNPVIGAGYRKLVRMEEINLGCHNTFLRIFGEAGLFVGLTFIAAVLSVALAGWRTNVPEVRCLAVGYMAMYSCACMVSHSLLNNRMSNIALGVVLGMISGAVVKKRQAKRERRQQQMMQDAARVPTHTTVAKQPVLPRSPSVPTAGPMPPTTTS